MTDLRKLLDAATKGPWKSTRTDPTEGYDCCWLTASPNGRNSETELGSISIPANAALIVAAVNALPAMLDVVDAAQRLQEWEDRASWLSANRPAFGSEPIYTTWWRASTKHDAARPAIAEALTAALAQWEKQNG